VREVISSACVTVSQNQSWIDWPSARCRESRDAPQDQNCFGSLLAVISQVRRKNALRSALEFTPAWLEASRRGRDLFALPRQTFLSAVVPFSIGSVIRVPLHLTSAI